MAMNILLSGASGRVGCEIERLVEADAAWRIVGRASRGAFFAAVAGADVVVDFSRPELTRRVLDFAVEHGLPLVIGTTGLGPELQQRISAAAAEIPICQAANFSLGINLLVTLVERAAAALPQDFDIEVAETHHRWKVDAPSGTARVLAQAASAARGHGNACDAPIRGAGARAPAEIGIQVARGGDVVGEHTVHFLGDGERLALAHLATDRAIFARGALHAARWLVGRGPGLYSMREVLASAAPFLAE